MGRDHDLSGSRMAEAIAAAGAAALAIYVVSKLRRANQRRNPDRGTPSGRRARALADHGIQVSKVITVNRTPDEVYRFWRDFQNLPRFMSRLESVEVTGGGRSHWKVKAPTGMTVEWDAELIDDRPGELISWRSVGEADVDNAGTVRFAPAPGDRGTEVRVELRYDVPGGKAGATAARAAAAISALFGASPGEVVMQDLRHFKQMMEIGEVVNSDASIHHGIHPARPAAEGEHVTIAGR